MILVLAIFAVLLALLLCGVQKARQSATRTACGNNLRQVALGVHLYADRSTAFPQGCAYPFAGNGTPITAQEGISWQSGILPDIDCQQIWQSVWSENAADPSGFRLASHPTMARVVPLLLCPAEARTVGTDGLGTTWGLKSYAGIAGSGVSHDDGIFHADLTVRFSDITDGTSTTVMIGERPPGPAGAFGGWYANWGNCTCQAAEIQPVRAAAPGWVGTTFCPARLALAPGSIESPCSIRYFWSLHTSGANFAFADGSARFLPDSAAGVLAALATRAGGEVVTLPE